MQTLKKFAGLAMGAAALVAVGGLAATEQQERGGEMPWMDRVSYSIGYDLALQTLEGLRIDRVDANKAMIIRGFSDAMLERDALLTTAEVDGILRRFHEQVSAAEVERRLESDPVYKELHDGNIRKSRAFLDKIAKEEGVKRLDSGVYYLVEREGTGKTPTASSTVVVSFDGRLIDGTEFISGDHETVPLATLLEGAQSVLTSMKVGGKWIVAIPPEKAFGAAGRPPLVGPHEVVLFEVELHEVMSD